MAVQDITRAVMQWHDVLKIRAAIAAGSGSPAGSPPELSPIDNSTMMVTIGADGELGFQDVGFEPLVSKDAKFDTVRKYVADELIKWGQELDESTIREQPFALSEYLHAKRRFMSRLFAIAEEPRPFNNVLQATALKLIDKIFDDIATAQGADVRGERFKDDRDMASREAYDQAKALEAEWEARRAALRNGSIDVVAGLPPGTADSDTAIVRRDNQMVDNLPPELRSLFSRVADDPALAVEIKDLADRYYRKHVPPPSVHMPSRLHIDGLDDETDDGDDGLPVV